MDDIVRILSLSNYSRVGRKMACRNVPCCWFAVETTSMSGVITHVRNKDSVKQTLPILLLGIIPFIFFLSFYSNEEKRGIRILNYSPLHEGYGKRFWVKKARVEAAQEFYLCQESYFKGEYIIWKIYCS